MPEKGLEMSLTHAFMMLIYQFIVVRVSQKAYCNGLTSIHLSVCPSVCLVGILNGTHHGQHAMQPAYI